MRDIRAELALVVHTLQECPSLLTRFNLYMNHIA